MKHAYKPVHVPSKQGMNMIVNHDLTQGAFDESPLMRHFGIALQ